MILRFKTLAPLVSLALLAACGSSPEEHFRQAETSFAAHRFSNARLDLIAAVDQRPDYVEALKLLAHTQLELGDGEAAQVALDRLGKLGVQTAEMPILRGEASLLRHSADEALNEVEGLDTAEAWRIRALAHIAKGELDNAGDDFAAGAKAPGPKARLLGENARFALLRGDPDEAARLARAALALDPAVLEGRLALAQTAVAQGRLDAALDEYERASAAYPENRAAFIGRAAALGDLGRTEDMRALLEGRPGLASDDLSVVYLRAGLAAADDDWQEVRKLIQPLEPRLGTLPEFALLYGRALEQLGLHEQAIAQLKSSLRRDPGNRAARLWLAKAQIGAGDAAGAAETLRARSKAPDAGLDELMVMEAAASLAGLPEAEALAKRIRDLAPKELARALVSGDAALKRQDWPAAARSYRHALELGDGTDVIVLNNLAFAEFQLGNRKRALVLAKRALALAPENSSVLDTAGWIMAKTGDDRAQGLRLLQKAARLSPENEAITRHIAEAGAD